MSQPATEKNNAPKTTPNHPVNENLYRALKPSDIKHTAGETIHNEITYRGVDWLVNATLGVSMAYFGQRTALGRRVFARPIEGFWKSVFSPIVKNEKTLSTAAEHGATFTGIALGGIVIIPPMQWLEQNKQPISQYFDEKIYGKERVKNDPRFAIRYQAVQERPEKDFWTGMASRFTVLTPMILTVMFAPNVMKKVMYNPIGSVTKNVAKRIKLEPEWMKTRKPFGAERTDWNFIHDTIAMDFGLSFIYAFAHEYTYKQMAKHGIIGFFSGNGKEQGATSEDPARVFEALDRKGPSPIIKTDGLAKHAPVNAPEQAVHHV